MWCCYLCSKRSPTLNRAIIIGNNKVEQQIIRLVLNWEVRNLETNLGSKESLEQGFLSLICRFIVSTGGTSK